MSLFKIKVTEDALLLLDGKVNTEAQAMVNRVKDMRRIATQHECADNIALFIAEVRESAEKNGELSCDGAWINYCRLCKRGPIAILYKSGRHKGQTKTDSPRRGIELQRSAVSFKGSVRLGCCLDCFEPITPLLQSELKGIPCDLPAKLSTEGQGWIKSKNKTCKKCGWVGHERQMGRLRTLMNDGFYYGKCPKCGGENLFLGIPIVVNAEGFTMLERAVTL